MEFNAPAGENLFDHGRVTGKGISRIDGPLKVTGRAPYAYERHDVVGDQLSGYPVLATVPQGRITAIDTAAALAAPGVLGIVTALEVGEMPHPFEQNVAPLFGGDRVHHYHQAIAVVVAEEFEQARTAAALVRVDYDAQTGAYDLDAVWQQKKGDHADPVARQGDFDAAFAQAAVTLDQEYRTPGHSHAMMEPHASIAAWQDGKVTVWTSNQMIAWNRQSLAKTLGLDQDDVRIESPFIGGGFGGKLFLRADAVLAALAARKLERPVKVALPRAAIMNNTTHRSATIQQLRIGADRDGRMTAISHEAISHSQPGGSGENAVDQTRWFYAAPNRLIVNHVAEMRLPEANAMRAPGEASGLMALEVAMDEMALKLGMDPVEFRALNDTQVSPEDPEIPFSDRNFRRCLHEGAKAFGWTNPAPRSQREGAWLIGQGMAGAYRGSPVLTSGARVRLLPDARLLVETDMTDIGTGSYTIIAQTAAETMGLPLEAVEVRLGDSDFPVSAGSGGQFGAASATAGVYAACLALQKRIAEVLQAGDAPLRFSDAQVHVGGRDIPLAELGELSAEDKITFGEFRDKQHIVSTFGAHFVEVAVHRLTGQIRLRRMLAVCDAGRILNPVTARSQLIGGMVMGVGAALMEEIAIDTDKGFFPNHDLASYEVPVHLDIPEQQVIFLDTADPVSTPLKAKGVGELGLCGVAAAIANAVHNASGVRIRDFPVTADKLLAGLG
ncbi:xanthine dehydrogenase family protein molybdopterin-binding subunit [Paracoccus shanxieyensis]|uniref:Molybdopterin-dependent oxidoreductase n=1 Tax=Paracoccus shanxieyensis TaxID=2675752 RepID=A0A6L6J0K7_9RHOB|nr:xanthine dehydrogenase family protein molybdopterin-binding subunit [Paracoccus shanxieyensis]MTH65669.1 molybdopterin-dependent oxidoreductase [Paracoccus shanxieyensis]MTH88756.1 molybdopterin-dependent oxidoreductase [Paracoccus shanxieyensis]